MVTKIGSQILATKFGFVPDCSLATGRYGCYFKDVISNLVLLIDDIFRPSYDNALRWMLRDLTDDRSALVQVMAWCHQATSHFLGQCWPRFLWPYSVTRPGWVKILFTHKLCLVQIIQCQGVVIILMPIMLYLCCLLALVLQGNICKYKKITSWELTDEFIYFIICHLDP